MNNLENCQFLFWAKFWSFLVNFFCTFFLSGKSRFSPKITFFGPLVRPKAKKLIFARWAWAFHITKLELGFWAYFCLILPHSKKTFIRTSKRISSEKITKIGRMVIRRPGRGFLFANLTTAHLTRKFALIFAFFDVTSLLMSNCVCCQKMTFFGALVRRKAKKRDLATYLRYTTTSHRGERTCGLFG